MTIEPTQDRVLLKRHPSESVTEGGIAIPESAQVKSNIAVVVAAGPDVPLSPGDNVMLGQYAGVNVSLEGEPHFLVKYDEILGVIRE